jgi:hypothetical protein
VIVSAIAVDIAGCKAVQAAVTTTRTLPPRRSALSKRSSVEREQHATFAGLTVTAAALASFAKDQNALDPRIRGLLQRPRPEHHHVAR